MEKRIKKRNLLDYEKIGKNIEFLRKQKGRSRKELAEKINSIYDEKSVDDWERRKIFPNLDSLKELAKVFNVTIDDLIECEKPITKAELLEKYPIFKPYEYDVKHDKKFYDGLYETRQKQLLKINARFKELVVLNYQRYLTRNENIEFKFLFDNMIKKSAYLECEEEDMNTDVYSEFLRLINELRGYKVSPDNIYWQVLQLIEIKPDYSLNCHLDEAMTLKNSYEHKKFLQKEKWEKDLELMKFQFEGSHDYGIDTNLSLLKTYEKNTGQKYDSEIFAKNLMKYLIDNGAVLNKTFYSLKIRKVIEERIIDRLEELYKICYKRIQFYWTDDSNKCHKESAENTEWNRFLIYYFYQLKEVFGEEYSARHLYELIKENPEIEIVHFFVKKYQVTHEDNTEYRYLKVKCKPYLNIWNKIRESYVNEEAKISKGIKEYNDLLIKFTNGETYYQKIEEEETMPDDIRIYSSYLRFGLKYNDFLKLRDYKKTQELRAEIDNLSLAEIKEKYFQSEVINHE